MNINKQTLSEQIYQILRADIISQVIPCGSKLTLKVLKERFGVSSTPIREALARLTEEQLLSYYSNLGVSVVSLGKEDIHEIYQFMGDLDSLAVRYASLYPDQQAVVGRLEENIRLMEACDLEDKAWAEYSDEFHLIFTSIAKTAASSIRLSRCAARCPYWLTSTRTIRKSRG